MASSDIDHPSTPAPVIGRVACAWRACTAEFASTHLLAIHLSLVHISPDPHAQHACLWKSCPQYEVPAPTRYDLILHLKVHTGDRAYLCPFDGCDKVYKRSDFLIRHTRQHSANLSSPLRRPAARAKDRQITPRAELLLLHSSSSESDDGDDDLVLQSSKRHLSASDSDSYHPPLSVASESTEAMLEAQLAYMREQISNHAKELARVKDKSRRLRLENDILIDALAHP
ncbi:Zinc finger protein ZIC 4 [Coemansia sp. RSA 2050]|nr:Zinc finger protein ZIC 4 [Coemansia sp. RSA 2050]KAJ2728111.1 Zinc finger protein ZIC 4 [Coemansia sp. BCRC 34962]